MKRYKTVDEYINQFPDDNLQTTLRKIRLVIQKAAPKAQDGISYGIPTYKLDGHNLVHFGAYKNHISFFPTSSPISVFQKELSKYKLTRGTIQFPNKSKIPFNLIAKITKFRVKQVLTKWGN